VKRAGPQSLPSFSAVIIPNSFKELPAAFGRYSINICEGRLRGHASS
jgi:hypothetical protein